MSNKRQYSYPILIIALLCCWSFSLFGMERSIIKVGLESLYRNVGQITLTSDTNMEIGSFDESGFTPFGTLNSSKLFIEKASKQYYDLGSLYTTFQAAYEAASSVQGIPVYIDKGIFAVYTTSPMGNSVISDSMQYVVKDENNQEILVFHKAATELVFRGYDEETSLHLTTVGGNKKYRGAIGVGGTTGLTPYNVVNMEEYLYGVIPCEMSASWPEEALKAQAVAARSIAIYQYNRYAKSGYNVVDTTTTQVYGGYNKEDSRTTAAVNATRGETIKYNGVVAEALYFSTSGGYTESAVNVWGNNIDYLVGVKDQYETEPAQGDWTRTITLAELNNCLASRGANIGTAQGIEIVSRTSSGRVQEMRILGSSGNYTVSKEDIRSFFSSTKGGSLKSRLFSLTGAINVGSSDVETTGESVAVLSASGMIELPLHEMIVTNGQLIEPITSENVAIQAANGSTEVSLQQSAEAGEQIASGETIWGDITIYGKGYGHGVGMSQSGAKGMAKAGFNYVQILQHYYNGVTVG
ncbi:MAG: SpoIID/LytB domain-containing protein [Cellulosilyticum sp.]|nr:SpoIID/LytB domain-containing protein [Cellulosilyticum sp.]